MSKNQAKVICAAQLSSCNLKVEITDSSADPHSFLSLATLLAWDSRREGTPLQTIWKTMLYSHKTHYETSVKAGRQEVLLTLSVPSPLATYHNNQTTPFESGKIT